ncbi:hypothetical protein [Pseudomonas sp. 31 R 17]|nr:hypothetical protein [Pseudomonas sp. 31 R 17]
MLPPSPTVVVALRTTSTLSMVSLIAVVAPLPATSNFSKLPPVASVILTVCVLLSMNTSSLGAGRVTVPMVSPALIVMFEPLSNFSVTSLPALFESVAVYVIWPPSLTALGAVRVTVVVLSVPGVSVTVVVTLSVPGTRFSKCSPPTTVLIAVVTVWSPLYTSSGAITETLPLDWFTPIVMLWPLSSVTVSGLVMLVTGAPFLSTRLAV